jgi:two-component system phosphate regulon sensor histidine kinase PhoR
MPNTRLLWHIFPSILVITLAAMGAATWYCTFAVKDFFYDHMHGDIEARATLLQPEINRLLEESPDELQAFCRRVGRQAATRITVIAGNGQVLADSNESPANMDNHGDRPEIITGFTGQVGSSIRFSKTLGHNRLYIALPAYSTSDGTNTVLRLSLPISAIEKALGSIHLKIFLGAVVVVAAVTLAAYSVARRISHPIVALQQSAEKLARGESLSPFQGGDYRVSLEMASLTTSFNAMADQVQHRLHDISRKNNELEAVFSSMIEPVMAIDTEEQIIRINRAAARLFNLDPSKITGQSFTGLIRNRELQALTTLVLEGGETVQEEVTVFDGIKEKQMRTRVAPLLDATDNSIGVLIVMNDMSRIHRLENLRREFVANVSHELKTPITSIKGYVETLLDGALDDKEDALAFLRVISKQGDRLNSIIDDLLTLSRIEQQDELVPLTTCYILPILESATQACSLYASEKQMQFDINCPANLEASISDALLEQAVINLLTNAITYSPPGSPIVVQAKEIVSERNEREITIQVQDKGIGIEPDHQKRIFERFYRCDKARSREGGGTGLGLAIVKHIAQSHGGNVEVESTPGKGSTFTIRLKG